MKGGIDDLMGPTVSSEAGSVRLPWRHREVHFAWDQPVVFSLPVLERPIDGTISQISDKGMFLATQRNLPLDSAVAMELPVPEGGAMQMTGTVVWLRKVGPRVSDPGLGIRFASMSPTTAEQLATLLDGLDEVGGDDPELGLASLDYRLEDL